MTGAGRQCDGAKRLLATLAGEATDRPPFWFMRQAGRYLAEYRRLRAEAGSFLGLCHDPARAAEATLQPVRRFGPDAAILFADILLLPEALGQRLDYAEGEGPRLEPIRDEAGLRRLDLARIHGRLAPVYETVALVRSALPAEVALIGFAGAPWTVATYMVEGGGSAEHRHIKRWAYGDPEGFARLIDLLVQGTIEYLAAQVRAGAEVLQLFDTWAGLLPAAEFERCCVAPTRAIVDGLRQRDIAVPVIGFPRGAGVGYRRYAETSGVDAVSCDQSLPPAWIAKTLQPTLTVQGNLDPQYLVLGGAPMAAAAETIFAALGRKRFVFNLGHGIVPDTPPEHVDALAAQIRGWAG
jgi:uroporphyrinogen decarboxylase